MDTHGRWYQDNVAPHEARWHVSYIHLSGCRVSRSFTSREAAQEFIDVNAMVFPLPGVRLEEVATMKQIQIQVKPPKRPDESTDAPTTDSRIARIWFS